MSLRPTLIKLVAFVTVTLLATGVLALTITNTGFGPTTEYKARFTDATGVNPGDDVRIAGVKAGHVDSIRIVDRRVAEVSFEMYDERKLSSSTSAVIKYRNLAGQRYIAIDQGVERSKEVLGEGGTIPLQRTKPALNLTVLLNGFKPLFQALSPEDVNKLSYEIIQVLQGEGGTINSVLSHTASLTSTIAERDLVIGRVIDNMNRTLDTVNARDDEASNAVVQLQQLVSGLAADRRPIGEAIEGIGELTDATSGLLAQGREPLREDIAHLGALAQNLNDHEAIVERFIQGLPDKTNNLRRAGGYGSWFNFYLCGLSGRIGVSPIGLTVPVAPPLGAQPPERCR